MTDWDDDILIGEGVALNTSAAPVTFRIVSGTLDLLVYGGAFLAVLYGVLPSLSELSVAWQGAGTITLIVICLVIAPATVESVTRGRSLGRLALGLRIVREDGGPVSFRHTFGRALVGLIEIYAVLGMAAVTASVLSTRGKRVGDTIMGTYAMRVRGARSALPAVDMPAWLRDWASTCDMRRLPDGIALTARMFLARCHDMHDASRSRIGTEIAAALNEYVAPAPPPGTHPESFIAAVLASRRDREYAYESRRAARAAQDMERLESLPYGIRDVDN